VYDTCGNEVVLPHQKINTAGIPPRAPGNPLIERGIADPIQCVELASATGNMWMNAAAVKQAIHVDTVNTTGPWTVCAGINYRRNTVTLLNTYPTLIANYRVLIFSGDADACVPWTGSDLWTRKLGYPVRTAWHPWVVSAGGDEWTAGFATEYDTPHGFWFYTIKHAGHMVPQYEPEAALHFFSAFLAGTPL